MTAATLLVVHTAATWFMTGAIWIVHVVHYPLFTYADRATYPAFAGAHGRRITPVVGWLSTALVQVPLHKQLAHGFDAQAHARLVASNWIRTVAWTVRSAMLLVMLARAMQPSR